MFSNATDTVPGRADKSPLQVTVIVEAGVTEDADTLANKSGCRMVKLGELMTMTGSAFETARMKNPDRIVFANSPPKEPAFGNVYWRVPVVAVVVEDMRRKDATVPLVGFVFQRAKVKLPLIPTLVQLVVNAVPAIATVLIVGLV